MTTDAKKYEHDGPEPPSEDFSTVGPIVPPLSSSKAAPTSPSPRQAWTVDGTRPDTTRTVSVPVGSRTPASQPSLSTTEKAFERVPSPPKVTVPPLKLQSIPRVVQVGIQSAKTSGQLHPTGIRLIGSPGGRPGGRPGNQSDRSSSRPNFVDPKNRALLPGAKGSSLPGQFGDSADSRNIQVSEGTGDDLGVLSPTLKPSNYQVLLKPSQPVPSQPVPPTSLRTGSQPSVTRRNLLAGQFKKSNSGGGKRTRKHRSVPSSVPVPAPATRRHHRDNSTANASSSQKRTRRRRPQRRDH